MLKNYDNFGTNLFKVVIRIRRVEWFSTFGSWQPTKHNITQFGDPYITIIVLKHRFWRPKSKCLRPKSGLRNTGLDHSSKPEKNSLESLVLESSSELKIFAFCLKLVVKSI